MSAHARHGSRLPGLSRGGSGVLPRSDQKENPLPAIAEGFSFSIFRFVFQKSFKGVFAFLMVRVYHGCMEKDCRLFKKIMKKFLSFLRNPFIREKNEGEKRCILEIFTSIPGFPGRPAKTEIRSSWICGPGKREYRSLGQGILPILHGGRN